MAGGGWNIELNDFPKELTQKRDTTECNFIFCLYKDTELYDDYRNLENGTDILTEDGMFYYGLAEGMIKAGYSTLDNISIHTYLSDKEVLR